MRTARLFAAACAALAVIGAAPAQLIPPPEEGDKLVTVKMVDGQVEMRDAQTKAPILMPKGVELWQDKNNANSLKPTIEVRAQPTGFDVVYTFVNSGQTARKLGALNIGILTLGQRVDYPDFRLICEPKYADYTENYKVRQMHYPDTLYSPSWVLTNKDYAVGVTLHYPIMKYKHSVRLCLYTPEGKFAQGEGGRGWRLEFLLSNVGNETESNKLLFPGIIPAGQTWTYVIAVRVTKKPSEWVRTMLPYRNWFRGEYGGVDYVRNPRCNNGRSFANETLCSPDNPYGFGESRPDKAGWYNIVTNLLKRKEWGSLMFWTPSGAYMVNQQNNMPFNFTTNWNATEALATAYNPDVGFPRLVAEGESIGFWWGRSVQVADKWDDDVLENLDPDNPKHRALAFAEMDLAVQAGATSIGLDTFSCKRTPVWKLVPWLHDLKARYPGVRFIAEPVTCDLIHREIPTFFRGNKDRQEVEKPEDIDGFTNPHYLADFLLPGHETWGSFRWTNYEEWFGIKFTEEEKLEQIRKIASLGFAPCIMADMPLLDPSIEAAKSWKYTVPPDLQIDEDGDGNGEDPFPTFELFHAAFQAGDPRCDLNNDGKLDFFDYTAWQNAHIPGGKPGGGGDGGGDEAAMSTGPGSGPAQRAASPSKAQRAPARPGTRTAGRAAKQAPGRRAADADRRAEIKVSGAPQRGAAPAAPSAGPAVVRPSPVSFSDDQIAAALARAKGLGPLQEDEDR